MIELLALLVAYPLIWTSGVLFLEISCGAARAGRRAPRPGNRKWSSAVVIPAHDEELSIAATLKSVFDDAGLQVRVIVVADNCTDATAKIARSAGAEVIERTDHDRRGKGHALAFARLHLSALPPDCVVVIDADTPPAPEAIGRLVEAAGLADRPVQAAYYIEPGPDSTSLARFSAIAFYVKNVVRQLGMSRMRVPAILTGSGMAFPWRLFEAMPLDTGHVTEDLMLGVWCSLADAPPAFVADAIVRGESSSDRGTRIQRRRWESGFFATACEYVPRLLVQGLRNRNPGLIWLALHLSTPPLLLLLALNGVMLFALAVIAIFSGVTGALFLLGGLTAGIVGALAVAIPAHGQRLTFSDLASVPGYVAWKLALTIRALVKRETSWIRTTRE